MQIQWRRWFAASCVTFAALAALKPAAADVVTDWSGIATATIFAAMPAERPSAGVHWPMVHIAMYDAVNAIDKSYSVFAVQPGAPTAGASEEAAAASAAYNVLKRLFPSQLVTLDAAYTTSLAAIADGRSKNRGVAIGEQVALALLQKRATDGRLIDVPYLFRSGPGEYQMTVPGPPSPVTPWLAKVTPFALKKASQFRGDGPAELYSAEYAADLEETQKVGQLNSAERTAAQTEIGSFHTMNPTLFWGNNLRAFVAEQDLSIAENARLLALIFVSYGDANIACWDSKYAFNRWRPSTAIRQADTDANPETIQDSTWTPQETTPPHPEYPAAHGCAAGAVMEALRQFYGTRHIDIAFTSTRLSGGASVTTTHRFFHTEDLLQEIEDARVYGGMHFRTSVQDGEALGRKVAKWVANHQFKPRYQPNRH